MKSTSILLLDFKPPAEALQTLKRQLSGMADSFLTIHHEQLSGLDMLTVQGAISTAMTRPLPHLVIVALSESAQLTNARIFELLLGLKPAPPIVVVPCSEEPHLIGELFRLGVSDYLLPPFRPVDVQPRIQRLLAYHQSLATPIAKIKQALGLSEFVGESPALVEQIQKIPRMARCDACVLITGETGTGKEVCARAIHYLSPRSAHPFVPLNCGAIPVDLLENELFGHEIGAYTSASVSRMGVIQEAEGGTLFLDEIDSLPLLAQVKLLRFLQEKTYRPLGAGKARKADVRVIAASNGNLEQMIRQGKLRQDLFYRLNILSLQLPPLHQRTEDIPLLARHFLAKYAAELKSKVRDFEPAALRKLSLYQWPGNVRELENIVERAIILSQGDSIQSSEIDLPVGPEPITEAKSFRQLKARMVAEFEQGFLRDLLVRYGGNIAQAARAAQKNRRVFFQLMRKHDIRVERPNLAKDGKPVANLVIRMDKNIRPSIRP